MKKTALVTAIALAAALPLVAAAHVHVQEPPPPPAPIAGSNQVAPLYPDAQPQVEARHVAHPVASQLARAQESTSQEVQPEPPADAPPSATVTIQTLHPTNTPFPPAPSFASLDTNRDGRLSHAEAKAYWPLDSDFLYASHEKSYVTRAEYHHWVVSQDVPTDH